MAEYGLQIKNLAGQVILRITDRVTRLLGSLETGTNSGSFAVPLPDGGSVFIIVDTTNGSAYSDGAVFPVITISGNVITWTFDNRTTGRVSLRLTYGIY